MLPLVREREITTQPPYQQVAELLREAIRTGELSAGQVVPSTKELSQRYKIAMSTAARALALLRDEGWIVSRPAKPALVAPRPPG
jgi:DNA-binding GntR family transcriptional regulator